MSKKNQNNFFSASFWLIFFATKKNYKKKKLNVLSRNLNRVYTYIFLGPKMINKKREFCVRCCLMCDNLSHFTGWSWKNCLKFYLFLDTTRKRKNFDGKFIDVNLFRQKRKKKYANLEILFCCISGIFVLNCGVSVAILSDFVLAWGKSVLFWCICGDSSRVFLWYL